MPGGGAVDEDAVLRAKQEIQSLVQEVVDLSKSEVEPTQFYAGAAREIDFGPRRDRRRRVDLRRGVRLQARVPGQPQADGAARKPRRDEPARPAAGAARQARRAGAGGAALRRGGWATTTRSIANPTEFLLVLAPIMTDRGVDGLVEIFQRTGARPNDAARLPAVPRADLRDRRRVSQDAPAARLRRQADAVGATRKLHRARCTSGSTRGSTAFTIANEGRRLDRLRSRHRGPQTRAQVRRSRRSAGRTRSTSGRTWFACCATCRPWSSKAARTCGTRATRRTCRRRSKRR